MKVAMKTDPITIADATASDVLGISDVQKETWLATFPNEEYGITREDVLSEDFRSPGRIEKRIAIIEDSMSKTKFFVAKRDKTVVGYCCAQRLVDWNYIKSIYILPAFQGKGIGTRLMEEAFAFLDQKKQTKLTVAVYSAEAIAFYEKLGFVKGKRLEHNPDGAFASGQEVPEMEMIKG